MRTMRKRDDAENSTGILGFRPADLQRPSRRTEAVPRTDRLKPAPSLLYAGRGMAPEHEQLFWHAGMTPWEKLHAFNCG